MAKHPYSRGTINRYAKRLLQDSALPFSILRMAKSASYCVDHTFSWKYQQPQGGKSTGLFCLKGFFGQSLTLPKQNSLQANKLPLWVPVLQGVPGLQDLGIWIASQSVVSWIWNIWNGGSLELLVGQVQIPDEAGRLHKSH